MELEVRDRPQPGRHDQDEQKYCAKAGQAKPQPFTIAGRKFLARGNASTGLGAMA